MSKVYVIAYEYDRNSPLFYQYGVARMLHVYKCNFDQVNDVISSFENSPDRQISWHMYTRDQFTDAFFGGIAEEWK